VLHFTKRSDLSDEENCGLMEPIIIVCAIDPETCGTAEPDSGHD
jgi:hypothetical protein